MRISTGPLARAAAAATGLLLTAAGTVSLAVAPASAAVSTTQFGFQTTAYGTRVTAEDVALASGRTAFSYISCTRLAGRSAHNYVGELAAPQADPQIHVQGVTSQNQTFRHPRRHEVGARGTNVIAGAVIGDPQGAHIALTGLRTVAEVAHRPGGWATTTQVTWKSLDIVPATGTPLDDATKKLLDTLDQGVQPVIKVLTDQAAPVEIPGVGSIAFGWERRTGNRFPGRASAGAYALRIHLYGADQRADTADDAQVALGRAWAHMSTGLPAGVMHGVGYAADADLAGGAARLGRVAAQPLPCSGTAGRTQVNHTVGLDLADAGAVQLGAMSGRAWGVQRKNGYARAWTEGSVASVALGTGDQRVVIKGIVGRATVRQAASGRVTANSAGSTIGSLTVGGEPRAVPAPGQDLTVPGLATIRFLVTQRGRRSATVTAVRITLLDGTTAGSVINLGNASARISRT